MFVKRLLILFAIACMQISGLPIANACTVKEVTQLVRKGAGKSAILEKCDGEISGAPRCSLREVVDLAMDDKSALDIKDRCKRCVIPVCSTAQGECRITMAASKIREGGECACPTPWGWAPQSTELKVQYSLSL